MNETAFFSYVQLLDSALPIGGFAHSFGLETYVQRGLVTNPAQLEAYIRGQIRHSLVRLDGPAVKGICRAIADHDMWRVALIDKIVHVQRVPRESREGLHQMGRRLLELGKKLYPDFALTRLEEALQRYERLWHTAHGARLDQLQAGRRRGCGGERLSVYRHHRHGEQRAAADSHRANRRRSS